MTAGPTRIRSANLPTTRGEYVKLPPLMHREEARAKWERSINDSQAVVALDLFCGAGGMSLGFEDAGFVIAAGIDADRVACETHAANFLAPTLCLDIGTVTNPAALMEELHIPRVDVVVGGPPCQGFSIAGMSKLRSLEANDPAVRREVDARNRLYREFVQFVRELRPLFFVMENVPSLGTYGDGVIAAEIRHDFHAIDYYVEPVTLDAAHYGVPQSRRRLFFIGSRIGPVWRTPRAGFRDHPRKLQDAIADLPVVGAPALDECLPYTAPLTGEYQALMRAGLRPEDRDVIYDHVVRPVREDDLVVFSQMQPGQTYRDVPEEYRRYRVDSFADKYYRLRWDMPGNTITAHMAKDGYRYIHPEQPRTLSVREAARVQSFPDCFRFAGHRSNRYRQIGNAVPPLLAQAIGAALARAIRRYRQMAVRDGITLFAHPSDADDPWQFGLPGFEHAPDLRSAGYLPAGPLRRKAAPAAAVGTLSRIADDDQDCRGS